jgi:hypothetical protein
MHRVFLLLAAGILGVVVPSRGAAQTSCTTTSGAGGTCSLTINMTLTTTDMLRLTLSAGSTTLTPPTLTDYDNGGKNDNGPTATVKANRAWSVQVSAPATTFTPSGGSTYNKPASDLLWGTAAGTYPNSMSTSAKLMNGNATAGASQQIFYRTKYFWDKDVPGTYSLQVNFTLSAP